MARTQRAKLLAPPARRVLLWLLQYLSNLPAFAATAGAEDESAAGAPRGRASRAAAVVDTRIARMRIGRRLAAAPGRGVQQPASEPAQRPHVASSTARMLPAGSLNQAIGGCPRETPFSSWSKPS